MITYKLYNIPYKLYLLNILLFFIISCTNNKNNKVYDFEKINSDSTLSFSNNNETIRLNNNLTQKYAHSGKNSILLKSKHSFALDTITINNTEAIKISIWRKGLNTAYVVFKTENKEISNLVRKSILKDENGWEKISYIFRLPPFFDEEKIIILVYNHSKEDAFFDDFKISKVKNILPNYLEGDAIKIEIDSVAEKKLLKYRDKALKNRTITKSSKKWVKAKFISKTDTFNIKLRFKGDWLDHLEGYKWSMRINIKGDQYWKGFKVFSIQNPDSKYIFDEYIYHEMLRENNVLSPKYGFVPLIINGVFAGIFSYEEHFTRQLVESKKRREGPILKFDEEPFWASNNYNVNNKEKVTLPVFETAKILAFGNKRIRKNKNLYNNYIVAQNLLFTYKNTDSIENIIDINKFAKFYSIVDLTGAYHSLIWHNIRFYYNPVSNLLEPIAFDGFTEEGIYPWTNNKMLIDYNNTTYTSDRYFIMRRFKNKDFLNEYFSSINTINDDKYFSNFLNKRKEDINYYESMLAIDYPDIKYNINYMEERIKSNKNTIQKIEDNYIFNNKLQTTNISKVYPINITKEYINIFPTEDSLTYEIENFNPVRLVIIGTSKEKNDILTTTKIELKPYNNKTNITILKTKNKIKYIYVANESKKDTIRIKVNKFIKPIIYTQHNKYVTQLFNDIIEINDKTITFKTGSHIITKAIVIPKGYTVKFNKNTNLDFINNAYLLSYSAIIINGTQQEPVIFKSSDKTAKGILIINAKQESIINFLNIKDFDTFSKNGWALTGAITFNETNVTINNLKISDNLCEDALNIVNSKFSVINTSFENIYSDAFDSDFSEGTINNCTFKNIKNDAIDFSGSKANIDNCSMKNIGDKAISAGEKSELIVNKTNVENANIAFASKDKSTLSVNNSNIKNCQYAYASYIKKQEFGKSELIITNTSYKKIKQILLIDKDCAITIDNNKKIGKEKLDVSKLYKEYTK